MLVGRSKVVVRGNCPTVSSFGGGEDVTNYIKELGI